MFYFGSNTKRNLGVAAHHEVAQAALTLAKSYSDAQFFLLPSIPFFRELKKKSEGTSLWIGNQTVSSISEQDITGEVSAHTLKNLNSDLVMIGHAERRRLFDGDKEIAAQLAAAAQDGLRVIFCIGEVFQSEDFDELAALFRRQLEPLSLLSIDLLIAYEPVFSIGINGTAADPNYIDQSLSIIRELLTEINLKSTPLLYGGSVNTQNASLYAALDACDGLFVGRSAWNSEGFKQVFLNGYAVSKKRS